MGWYWLVEVEWNASSSLVASAGGASIVASLCPWHDGNSSNFGSGGKRDGMVDWILPIESLD